MPGSRALQLVNHFFLTIYTKRLGDRVFHPFTLQHPVHLPYRLAVGQIVNHFIDMPDENVVDEFL